MSVGLMAALFWLSVAVIVYSVFGYAVILLLVAKFIRRPKTEADITPEVALLIAAHNEEAVIREKLDNTLALDYPRESLHVIVVSDGSDDGTNKIAMEYADRGVVLHALEDRKGKTEALNSALDTVQAEIVVISDSNSMYAPDAIRKLVRHFADPKVGAVTGEERRFATGENSASGEGLYCRLDNLIKRLESETGSMVMVNGGFVAIRRSLWPKLDAHVNYDAAWPSLLVLQGYRVAYEEQAVSTETYPLDSKSDFQRRIRTVVLALDGYLAVPQALNPLRTGWYAVKLLSHRIGRWFLLPWLTLALVSNVLLARSDITYQVLLAVQGVFWGCALVGWLLEALGKRARLFYLPFYFAYMHVAAFCGACLVLTGKKMATWQPSGRVAASGLDPGANSEGS
jgi:cellulose synthase/poly-beta-1,6-N-acetylglucosamine synthase-like glycosyltransferase